MFRAVLLAVGFFFSVSAVYGAALGQARFSWGAVTDPTVSGYTVHWGTQSGIYDQSVDAGNVTEVIIAAFSQGTEYFLAITSYSASGEVSGYSPEISFIYDVSRRAVLLEAENGVLSAPMQIVTDGTTTGVAASPANSTAATTLSFDTPYATDYFIWCRVLAPSASADSMFVMLDQQPEQIYYAYGEPSPPTAAFVGTWIWSRIQVSPGIAQAYALSAGSHSIRFRCRDNSWLDRVVIVNSPDFVPSDTLPSSGDSVTVVRQPHSGAVAIGGTVTLTATLVATAPIIVKWFHDGVAVPDSNQLSLTLSNVQASAGGTYTLSAWLNAAIVTTQPATLTVLAAGSMTPPWITTPPSSAAISYGQTLADSSLSGGAASVPGFFAFTTPTTAPAAGMATQSVTFTPTDTSRYQSVSISVNVTVYRATPMITSQPTASAIFPGQSLASSKLVGGAASVTGSFAFTAPAAIPLIGSASQSVTFTPADTGNYLTATTSVMVQSAAFQPITQESLASWRARCFTPGQIAAGIAANDADADGDGLTNLAEYALGTNPLIFTPPLTAVKNSAGLVLVFNRPAGLPDVLYAAESSDDLINWHPCTLEMLADGPVQTMRAVDPLTSGNPAQRFISLRFTRP